MNYNYRFSKQGKICSKHDLRPSGRDPRKVFWVDFHVSGKVTDIFTFIYFCLRFQFRGNGIFYKAALAG